MNSLQVLLAILGAAFASMAVFALLGAGRDADATKKNTQFAGGAGNFLVHWFMWVIGPIERLFLALGATPDVFNFAGLFFGAVSGVCIGLGHLEAGGWAIAAGGVCDILDGRIARARKLDSDYGKFIDSTLDRFVEVFCLLGFVWFLRDRFEHGALVAAAALAGSLLVSYARARGESLGVLCKEGLMQRAERLVLTCLVCLSDTALSERFGWPRGTPSLWVLGAIALGTFWTATHRTIWISRRLLERAK